MRTVPWTTFARSTGAGRRLEPVTPPVSTPRPASVIVAKDTAAPVELVAEHARGVLVVEAPDIAKQMGRLLVRDSSEFRIVKRMANVRGPAALSPDGSRLLVGGPIYRKRGFKTGDYAASILIDVAAWKVVRVLPLVAPFVWIDNTRFVAQTPGWEIDMLQPKGERRGKRSVDPKIARGNEHWMTDDFGMVMVDLEAEASTRILESQDLDWETRAVLSADRAVLYSATSFGRVTAVRIADGKRLWQRPPARLVTDGSVYAIALDAMQNRIVVAGGGATDLTFLDAKTGRPGLAANVCSELARAGFRKANRFDAIAISTAGWISLGTNAGTVVDLPPGQPWRAYQAGPQGIRAMSFVDGGRTLLLGGAEKGLRTVSYSFDQDAA